MKMTDVQRQTVNAKFSRELQRNLRVAYYRDSTRYFSYF